MPVNDLGYRKWDGEIRSPYWRWLTIALAGIKIVYKSQWIKRIMFVAWGPALLVGLVFFFYEQYVENRDKVAPTDELNETIDEGFDPQQLRDAAEKIKQVREGNFMEEIPSARPESPGTSKEKNKQGPPTKGEPPSRPPPGNSHLANTQPGTSQQGPPQEGPRGPPPGPRKGPPGEFQGGEFQGGEFQDGDFRGDDFRKGPPRGRRGFEEQIQYDENGQPIKGYRQYLRENRRYNGFEPMVGLFFFFASESQINRLLKSFTKEPNEARGYVWSFILLQMLRRTQGWMVLVLIGLITPPLISKDIRSRAFLFYFSKPISRTDYLLGKFAVVGFFVGFVTLLPALALYVFGVVLSPSLSVVLSTWYLPIQVVAACLVSIVPACLIGLALSSMTSESRFAGFAWFMVWILGFVGYQIVNFVQRNQPNGRFITEDIDSYWRMVSLYDCLGYLQGWVMGVETNHSYALVLLSFVITICVFCVYVIMKNISAPLKA